MRVVSLFSGCMGLDLGLEQAGMETVCAVEIDRTCCQTIRKNRPALPLVEGDVRQVSADKLMEMAGGWVDVLAGGPPCQAFSTAGQRRGMADERGNVFLRFLELAAELRPRYVVIENVRGIYYAKDGDEPVLTMVTRRLEESGYSVSFTLYDASFYGVPQRRERMVMIASRDGEVPLIPPTHGNGSNGLPLWVTFRQATQGLSSHRCGRFSEKVLKYLRLLKPGQDWVDLPKELQAEAMGAAYLCGGGQRGFYRRVAWDRPCPTLMTAPTQKATMLAHPTEDRPLSVEEYMAIQQFPGSWQLAGSLSAQYRQLGNAVPVGLGAAIGRHLMSWDALDAPGRRKLLLEAPREGHSRYHNTSHREVLRGVSPVWAIDGLPNDWDCTARQGARLCLGKRMFMASKARSKKAS
jgi:DNA (cytosine-5)-methyltransferase 1